MKNNVYEKYLTVWLSGLQDEIWFWNHYMQTEGGVSFYGYQKTVSSQRKFELEKDIPLVAYGKEFHFIDVGSGPFSRCGVVTDKVKLHATSLDPLANIYMILKKKYHIENGIDLQNGFVELLSKQYSSNTFDMVHMSNSLDHCFSAIDAIYQLLYICKIGGKVVLRHAENEALRENYQGLHQWNLSLHNDEHSFIIWRENERYDICKMFEEYADIKLFPDIRVEGGHWIYNKVVMTKKKNVDVRHDDEYYSIMLNVVSELYTKELLTMNNIINTIKGDNESRIDERINRIRKAWHSKNKTKIALSENKWNSFIIYGMGYVGANLDYLLSEMGIQAIKLDQKGKNSLCFEAVKLEECRDFNVDIIILTIDNEEAYSKLLEHKNDKTLLVTIDEFLDAIESMKEL